MRCPYCGDTKVIVDYSAPIGGSYVDDDGKIHNRLRCAGCNSPIDMQVLQPPKGGKLGLHDNQEHQDNP